MAKDKKIKSIYFVGIKGVGMTPLAILAKQAGFQVKGSDIKESFITDAPLLESGIKPTDGFNSQDVEGSYLVITTGAHGGLANLQVQTAKTLNIPVWTQGQAVGEFMNGKLFNKSFYGVSVAGSHGKTTTTAMIATILKESGLDPSYVIGTSKINPLGLPGHFGKGKYFIAEADEYATDPVFDKTPKLLWQHPQLAVVNNIEFDHPDVYKDINQISKAFESFINGLSSQSVLIINPKDPQSKKISEQFKGYSITFGFGPENDYSVKRISQSYDQTFFWVKRKDITVGEFCIGVAGEHNVLNALASIAAAIEFGLSVDKIKEALGKFKGCKRRAEYIGEMSSGALVFDDYAHHPTEIKKTLSTFRKNFPKKNIVCIFQPHTYSRTNSLFEQFSSSFNDVNTVILTEIYPSLREKEDLSFSSQKLALSIQKFKHETVFVPKLSDVVEYVNQKQYKADTLIITMGAGDVYKIAEQLV